PIVGNIPDVLEDLLKLMHGTRAPDVKAWWKQIDEWRAKDCLKYDRGSKIIKPQFVLEKLYEVTKGQAFVTSDVGQHQMWAEQFFHGNRYSESYMDALPDFVKLAEGYGHRGMLVEKPADVEPALREAFANKKELVFLDFITDQTENVWPMIPAGKGITEMILS